MADSAILTLRLDQHLRNRLDKLAKPTKRLRSFLAAEAIREYVALNDRQIEEIRKGIAEANRGEFATPAEVARLGKKWTRRARPMALQRVQQPPSRNRVRRRRKPFRGNSAVSIASANSR